MEKESNRGKEKRGGGYGVGEKNNGTINGETKVSHQLRKKG